MQGNGFGKGALAKAGYDHEAAYFHRRDQELIHKNRTSRNSFYVIDGGGQSAKPRNHSSGERKAA